MPPLSSPARMLLAISLSIVNVVIGLPLVFGLGITAAGSHTEPAKLIYYLTGAAFWMISLFGLLLALIAIYGKAFKKPALTAWCLKVITRAAILLFAILVLVWTIWMVKGSF